MKPIEAIVKATLLATLLGGGCKSVQTESSDKAEKPEFKPSALVDVGAHVGEKHNLRTQGLIVPIKGGSLGFLHDATTEKALPLDSASSYLQLRPNYDVIKTPYGNIGIIGMAELGPGFEDRARLGISITPKVKGFFTQFRIFPLKSGQPGIRADNFSSVKILDGVTTDLLTSYRKGYRCDGENQLYLEPMVRCDIGRLTGVKALKGFYAGAVGKYSHNFRTNIGKGELQAQLGYRLKLP